MFTYIYSWMIFVILLATNLILKIKSKYNKSNLHEILNLEKCPSEDFKKKVFDHLEKLFGITFANQFKILYKWIPFEIEKNHGKGKSDDNEINEEERQKIN